MKRQIGIAVAAACVLLIQISAASADAVRLRIGWAQVPSQITPLVAELSKTHPEFFPGLGKSYTYEPIRFQGSTPQIQALAAGELEIGAFGPSALALAVLNARLDMRMIADVMQDGGEDYYSTWWAVKKDGPIKSFADFKGHTAVVNAKGATTDMHLRGLMRRHGVADSDYAIIEADFANMLAMVENGKADRLERISVKGDLPSPANPPQGCHFAPRCSHAMEQCRRGYPPATKIASSHGVRCYLYGDDLG